MLQSLHNSTKLDTNMNNEHNRIHKSISRAVELKARKGPRKGWNNRTSTSKVKSVLKTKNMPKVLKAGQEAMDKIRKRIKRYSKKLPKPQDMKLHDTSNKSHLVTIQYANSDCFTHSEMYPLLGFFPKRKGDVLFDDSAIKMKVANCSDNVVLKNSNYRLEKESGETLLIHLRNVLSSNAITGLKFISFIHAHNVKNNTDLKVSTPIHLIICKP